PLDTSHNSRIKLTRGRGLNETKGCLDATEIRPGRGRDRATPPLTAGGRAAGPADAGWGGCPPPLPGPAGARAGSGRDPARARPQRSSRLVGQADRVGVVAPAQVDVPAPGPGKVHYGRSRRGTDLALVPDVGALQ